jgi:hypothetical protein
MENRVTDVTIPPIAAGQTFTSQIYEVGDYNSLIVACKTDKAGIVYVDFSVDNENTHWDSTLTYDIAADLNEVHRIVVTRRFCRFRFYNSSAADQTYIRFQAINGNHEALTSNLNSVIQNDADSTVVRPVDFNILVSEGLYQNRNVTLKDGVNFDIDTASTPQDITNEGGVYAGFPRGTIEAGEIVVAGADTGTVVYSYMATATDTDYTFASKAVTGAGTYALGHNIFRCNFAYYYSTSATAFNLGNITIRNTVTTANVFCVIPTGYSQSFCAAYTVPYGSSVYIDRFNGSVRGSATASLDGYIWYRANNESPRYRFPFELQFGTLYFDDVDYLIKIPALTDFIPRVLTSSANNIQAKLSFRLLKVKS